MKIRTQIDELQNTVDRAFGAGTTILASDDNNVLVRYSKGGHVEYATFKHDFKSIFSGSYFPSYGVGKETAGKYGWESYHERKDVK